MFGSQSSGLIANTYEIPEYCNVYSRAPWSYVPGRTAPNRSWTAFVVNVPGSNLDEPKVTGVVQCSSLSVMRQRLCVTESNSSSSPQSRTRRRGLSASNGRISLWTISRSPP
eukprot:Amastigsp_a509796_52.p3 type:complete len:112 gc:universal Amastigsp_a509796_52:462-127(-)